MAQKLHATASVEVFDVAHGDPTMTDYGYAQLDVMHKCFKRGAVSCFANGVPKLQLIDDYGMTNKPFVNPVDMRLSQHTCTPSGSWDELQSVGGLRETYHLRMYDNSPGLQYVCKSTYNLAANPCFAISMLVPENAALNWDYSLEPYTRIEFGNGMFGVTFSRQYGAFLLRKVSGIWVWVADIKGGSDAPSQLQTDEKWVFIRCENGAVLISTDFGKEYTVYTNPDGSPINVPAGPWQVVGQGGTIGLGIGELVPNDATFINAPANTFATRPPFAAPVIAGRYWLPSTVGASVSFNDLSQPSYQMAQWSATLMPVRTQNIPFRMWQSPVLQNVTFRYPYQRVVTSNTITTPWDPWLLEINVSKPKKLAESTCTIIVHKNASLVASGPDIGPMRWRKVRVKVGFKWDDGSVTLDTVFTGYVRSITEERSDFDTVHYRVELVNLAYIIKRDQWKPWEIVSFAGLSPQAVGDYILKSKGLMDEAGLDRTYANWFTTSLPIPPLSPGKWDEPFETIKPNESKWATLERVFGYYGFEVGVDNNGVLISLPENYVSPTIDWDLYANWDGVNTENIQKQLATATHNTNIEECCTMVVVYGKADTGDLAVFVAVDGVAETNATNERFSPFRDVFLQEFGEAHGAPDIAIMQYKAQVLATAMFGLRRDVSAEFPIKADLSRKAGIALHNCVPISIPEGTKFSLETITITFKADTSISELHTVAGLRRV